MESLTYLPCFKPRSYPSPVLSVAKDHPVYINGTKLVNGHPVLTGNKTDESRIDEFKAQGFSREYIQELTDSSFYSYYFGTGIKGTKCNYGSSLPYKPSYSKIGNITVLNDPCNDLVKHVIEIKNHEVFFNGSIIASAPITGDNGRKKTLAQQLTFCKAVIYSIIPGSIQRPIKDHPSGCVVYESVPDDEYLRELISKYPAVIDNQIDDVKEEMMDRIAINALPGIIAISAPIVAPAEPIAVCEPIPVTLPAVVETFEEQEYTGRGQLNMFSNEAITGYPHTKITEESTFYHEQLFNEGTADLKNIMDDEVFNMGSELDSIMLENEYNRGEEIELYDLTYPAIVQNVVRAWALPYLRCTIVEEVVLA